MIKITRGPTPAFLLEKGKKWQKETAAAIKHYKTSTKGFEFQHYGDPELRAELNKVFKGKCAYCESRYAHLTDGDVEHFRPKGKVKEKDPQVPGYYWLANDWDNLLMACTFCNQNRKHQLHDDETLRAQGKLDQFPLTDPQKRVTKPGSLKKENDHRLLINPCIEDPDDHFEYAEDEVLPIMIGITDMGKKSIEIFVLGRVELVQYRNQLWDSLKSQMGRVVKRFNQLKSDSSQERLDEFIYEYNELKYMGNADRLFAGMARFYIRKFLDKNPEIKQNPL